MKPLSCLPFALLCFATPAVSADLDGPVYRERDVVIERPAPPRVIERERIIERHYYAPPPVYREERVYVEPTYEPREYAYYERPYRYAYSDWRPRHFFPRRVFWHRHHHHGW